tara:strand:+ start:1493 stop:2767 length:1275 start_codon:yes stop_codon:yes gene_type:complete
MTGIIKNNEGRSSGLKKAAAAGVDGVNWQTGDIKTSTFTAESGKGYFCNTSGGAFEVDLPAGSAGAIVAIQDYNNTFDSNSLTIDPNGSEKINGGEGTLILNSEGQGLTLIYIDSTVGWRSIQENEFETPASAFITASGGTITTSGNFKIHTFTSPGTFCVSAVSGTAAENTVGYMVVAGGGGGGAVRGGGGGGGGFREGRNVPVDNFTASPLVANAPTNAITVTATGFPITVGAGGALSTSPTDGANSVFSSITATGGGNGGTQEGSKHAGGCGGSGGGGGGDPSGSTNSGLGNTPPVSPAQGTNGAVGNVRTGGGGGGATAAGSAASGPAGNGGAGGAGATTSITGSPVAYGGGGGGGSQSGTKGSGGAGGGGDGGDAPAPACAAENGTANTGGGGGGQGDYSVSCSGNGGSGVVIIRYKYQ